MPYYKVFSHLLVGSGGNYPMEGSCLPIGEQSTIPTLLYPLTVKHTSALEH